MLGDRTGQGPGPSARGVKGREGLGLGRGRHRSFLRAVRKQAVREIFHDEKPKDGFQCELAERSLSLTEEART